jgi:predicted metal-binding protein
MGMYDVIIFTCPRCSARVELQTKAGECSLRGYLASEVPAKMAQEENLERVHCTGCDRTFVARILEAQREFETMVLVDPANLRDGG